MADKQHLSIEALDNVDLVIMCGSRNSRCTKEYFLTADEIPLLDDELLSLMCFSSYAMAKSCEESPATSSEFGTAEDFANYHQLINDECIRRNIDVTEIEQNFDEWQGKACAFIEVNEGKDGIRYNPGTKLLHHQYEPQFCLSESDFFTDKELAWLDDDALSSVLIGASARKDKLDEWSQLDIEGGNPYDPAVVSAYYDRVRTVCEDRGLDIDVIEQGRDAAIQEVHDAFVPDVAQAKLQSMMENPMEFPKEDFLLNAEELHSLDNATLCQQFAFARFCAKEKHEYSHDHRILPKEGEASQDVPEGETVVQGIYGAYYDAVYAECESRGYDMKVLEQAADENITKAQQASIASVLDMPGYLNIHMLAAMNDTDEQMLYYYLTLSDAEKEMTPCFKTVLKDDTSGIHSGYRWDGADSGATPLQKDALTVEQSTFFGIPVAKQELDALTERLPDWGPLSRVTETKEYSADLMAQWYTGTEYEVSIYKYEDSSGRTMMACRSPYLGDFEYDPREYAVGYKLSPETNSVIPVLQYVGDLEADWQHGHQSPLSMVIDDGNWGDALPKFGSNMLGLVNNIDFMGIIPDTDEVGGSTKSQQVRIPYGVKNLDYTFMNNNQLQLIPAIPETVNSMHCTFMNCTSLHEGSEQFLYDDRWHIPDSVEDLSYTFAGCTDLGSKQIGDMPYNLMTVDGMFYDCPKILDPPVWENHGLSMNALFGKTVEANWSDCKFLREQFFLPVNENTNNKMKQNYEKELQEHREFIAKFDDPEFYEANLPTEEEKQKFKDANARQAADRTIKVLNAENTVRDINTVSYNAPDGDGFKGFLQRAMIDVGTFAALKGITGGITGSKVAGWAAGLGGTALLRITNILPRSIEPVLQLIKNILPKDAQAGMDKVIDWFHLSGEEEEKAAKRDQMSRYKDLALRDSMRNSVWSADIFYDDAEVFDAMRVNGKAVAEYGVLQYCGEEGRETVGSVKETLNESLSQAERVFDKKMTGMVAGTNGDNVDWKLEMKRYYMQMFRGLEGYSAGATEGIMSTYSTEEKTTGEKVKDKAKSLFGKGENAEETQMRMSNAQTGLAYVNCEYAQTVMESMMKMNDKYQFMEMEDWMELGSMSIYGVDTSSLMYYEPGQTLTPSYIGYDGPADINALRTAGMQQNSLYDTQQPVTEVPSTQPTGEVKDNTSTKTTSPKKTTHDERVKQAEALSNGIGSDDELQNEAMGVSVK